VTGRLDRLRNGRGVHGTHDVTLRSDLPAGVQMSLAHRSSFRPPSMGDQFFQEGVGVRANPDLRAERVPSEFEAAISVTKAAWSVSAAAYHGDVRDLIVWLPDFRFVWSPTNTNVRRSGLNVSAELTVPGSGLSLGASYDLARITYDRDGGDDVQVAYRPRHSARVETRWRHSRWTTALVGRYIGVRYPVPNAVNGLPGFWATELRVSHDWNVGDWRLRAGIDVDRLLDETASLIYAFPDPGRTVRFSLELRRQS
jgi:vitamin B12 transporter